MKHTPLFSIVIPAYNYAQTLARAIESVLTQSGSDFELLVINDGSSDNTQDVLQQLHNAYPSRFCSVNRTNFGAAATRNYGVEHTSGDWLIFLDSDDEFEPNALEIMREAIKENADARMIVGGHTSVAEDGSCRYRGIDAVHNSKANAEALFAGYLLNKSVTPSNGATAMHRDIFKKIRYPENFRNSEDIPVFACSFANFPCAFIEKPINRVYKHDDSLRHNIAYAHAVGTSLIDVVFDPAVIPGRLQKYRKAYFSQRCLSLFRTHYLAGDSASALVYYRLAVKNHWTVIFNASYARKALRCFFTRKNSGRDAM
ncbi:glycosyltransferase family 2 protein [Parendozoicomonas haliclonae]|uniref:Hyaluronan synthase n=1 Tax=Parendozoicomonas haliclonae TaxID=1960125 RepID=A0A1X7AFU5_9GAMM|nr:glycosyltransferase family 2 protein [Parendozoicomonas haliclonae]SMA31361.1 Hyaluronan synthase [Parendozoicomonas haliclonae]